jgi:RNA polymerase sigma factor (sigma-70 family)
MAQASIASRGASRPLRALFTVGAAGDRTDADLLDRFHRRRDADAFALLVERHGPMVLRVCRDILADTHDAHDAFQATFLVLLRRARQVRKPGSIGPWLHGVARRVAWKARGRAARRAACERRAALGRSEAVADPPGQHLEFGHALHEEIGRLPPHYRAPIVLCYLEGLTHEQAAARLGWPVGTVRGRMARARDRLRARLTRRGLAPLVMLPPWIAPTPPEALVRSVLNFATANAPNLAAGLVPAAVAALANGGLRSMLLGKPALFAMNLGLAGVIAAGAALVRSDGPAHDAAPTGAPTALDEPVVVTYNIVDLAARRPDAGQPSKSEEPLLELIAATVAPGSWQGRDAEGRSSAAEFAAAPAEKPGTLELSADGRYLRVHHDRETQRQVSALLGRLRRVRLGPRGTDATAPDLVEPHQGGSGVAVTDFDLDGRPDVLVAQPVARSYHAMFRNLDCRSCHSTAPRFDSFWPTILHDPSRSQAQPASSREPREIKEALSNYRVEHPDILFVEIDLEPRFSGELVVRPEGDIEIPRYGKLQVQGRKISEIKLDLVKQLRSKSSDLELGLVELQDGQLAPVPPERSPKTTVQVASYNSQVYHVEGAVKSPGRLPITGRVTVLDAINYAGGLQDGVRSLRDVRASVLRRRNPTGPSEVLTVNLSAILEKGRTDTNFVLQAGDRLIVEAAPARADARPEPRTDPNAAPPTDAHLAQRLDDQETRLRVLEEKIDRVLQALDRDRK